jgi:hypothetical protein
MGGPPFGLEHGDAFPTVQRVKPGSQASLCPQLRPGLALVGVQGQSVVGLSLTEVKAKVMAAAGQPITLTFGADGSVYSSAIAQSFIAECDRTLNAAVESAIRAATPSRSSGSGGGALVSATFMGGPPFGLEHGDAFPTVQRVKPGSQASLCPQLRPGLALVGVQGQSVVGMSLTEVKAKVVAAAGQPITLTFGSDDSRGGGDSSGGGAAASAQFADGYDENLPALAAGMLIDYEDPFEECWRRGCIREVRNLDRHLFEVQFEDADKPETVMLRPGNDDWRRGHIQSVVGLSLKEVQAKVVAAAGQPITLTFGSDDSIALQPAQQSAGPSQQVYEQATSVAAPILTLLRKARLEQHAEAFHDMGCVELADLADLNFSDTPFLRKLEFKRLMRVTTRTCIIHIHILLTCISILFTFLKSRATNIRMSGPDIYLALSASFGCCGTESINCCARRQVAVRM